MKLEYQRQAELPAIRDLDFDERFSMIVNEQYSARKDSKIKRLVKAADLRDPSAYLANIDYEPVRKIKKADVARLSNCFVGSDPNVGIRQDHIMLNTHIFQTIYSIKPLIYRLHKKLIFFSRVFYHSESLLLSANHLRPHFLSLYTLRHHRREYTLCEYL